jgi:hypothetical protein
LNLFKSSPQFHLGVRRNTMVDKILYKECFKCESIKPPLVHHCPICKRCVAFMDHHCPWINNCVGLYTQKPFILFNFYAFLGILYVLLVTLVNGLNELKTVPLNITTFHFFLFGTTLFELAIFLLFILVVLID